MARRKKKKRKGSPGNGLGPHAETSPMGHATRTPAKADKIRQEERRAKQQGWAGCLN